MESIITATKSKLSLKKNTITRFVPLDTTPAGAGRHAHKLAAPSSLVTITSVI